MADEGGETVYVYCKFLRFMVWATLKDIHPNINHELKVFPEDGTVRFPQQVADAHLLQSLLPRIAQIESMNGPSEQQMEKINREVERNPASTNDSDAGIAIQNDLRMDH